MTITPLPHEPMSQQTDTTEAHLLSCCYLDHEVIDRAMQAGVTVESFSNVYYREQWSFLCHMRLGGKPIAVDTVYSEALAVGKLEAIGGLDTIVAVSGGMPTTAHAASHIGAILSNAALRASWRLLVVAMDSIKAGTANMADIKAVGEQVAAVCSGEQRVSRVLSDVADEAIKDAEEAIKGDKVTRCQITTGLATFDRYATPMESHEYVVVGARTSQGKSSFLLQVAGHNLSHGKRVVIFTLETSAKAVIKQIVGQRAGINLRNLAGEMPAKQQEYLDKLRYAKTTKNLLVFDRDLTLAAIESRCRLLVSSFQPHLVIVDYLGLMKVDGKSPYERMSMASKAMIPLQKSLGCTLLVGSQLSRESEKEQREPIKADLRDSGSVEEDSARIILIARTAGQALDLDWYDGALLQPKLRDGPTTRVPIRFHAPTAKFFEQYTP